MFFWCTKHDSTTTPQKTNISLEKLWLEDELAFWNGTFPGDLSIFRGNNSACQINQSPETDRTRDCLLNQPLETGTRHHVFQGWSARPVEVRIFRMREVCNSTSTTIQSTINLPMLSMLSNVQLLGIAHLLMSQISRYWEVDWGWGISGRFSTRPFWRPFFLCEKCPRITRAIV